MNIPDKDNVASVLVDGVMWSTEPRGEVTGWAAGEGWLSVPDFETFLDGAEDVIFYSPTGKQITG